MRIDVRPNHEPDEVEERDPQLVGQEGLREGERERRRDPADFHHGHEAGADGGADLVEGAGAGDDGHGGEVDDVLDGGDLGERLASAVIRMDQWNIRSGWRR